MDDKDIKELIAAQCKIERILVKYGCEEYSNAILNEICNAMGVVGQ